MTLSSYHQKYASLPNEELGKRAQAKQEEFEQIFQTIALPEVGDTVRVGVMGCGDERFIEHHREIFPTFFQKPAHITTFDISIEHLAGGNDVYQHDVTLPLPHGPFDITYAHVLLKFIETEKQWDVLKNSYDALTPGGLAIHVFDNEEIDSTDIILPSGQYAVPLKQWEEKLCGLGIEYHEIPVKYGLALVLKRA